MVLKFQSISCTLSIAQSIVCISLNSILVFSVTLSKYGKKEVILYEREMLTQSELQKDSKIHNFD